MKTPQKFTITDFHAEYARRLEKAVTDHPEEYALRGAAPSVYAEVVATRIIHTITTQARDRASNIGVIMSPTLKAAMRVFGITTQKALLDAFWNASDLQIPY